MRFREDKPADLERARTAVAQWREQNPAGTQDQLTDAAPDEEGGRGLAIVAALCKQWHYRPSTRVARWCRPN